MLRQFLWAFSKVYPSSALTRNIISVLRMSSNDSIDTLKRKPDELENEEIVVDSKKLKSEEVVENIIGKISENFNRTRKPKKVVLLLSYLGKDFYGMQRNANVATVEEELFKSMLESKIILKEEFDFPKQMKFQRAARTDKGVSAVRNIVSLKIPVKEISDTLPQKINQLLPPEVRVVAVKRVTQSFDAKIACDARTYAYMLPTFAFAPESEGVAEDYRITEDRIKEVNSFLTNYIGTHNFYNFTSGRLACDPSCKRFIISMECGSPFDTCGIEFSVIKVKGQSFMLHQIRKMVGLAIAYMRNLADASVLDKAWHSERIDIPKAPGLGLMLEELHYDWYNSKYGTDGIHDPLTWDEFDEVVNTFKKENICCNIAKSEREEKSMLQWLATLPHHSYDVRDAGPPSQLPNKSNDIATHLEEKTDNNENVKLCDDDSLSNVIDSVSESCQNVIEPEIKS